MTLEFEDGSEDSQVAQGAQHSSMIVGPAILCLG